MTPDAMPRRPDLVQSITRRYEFDTGHRLPTHPGKCARLHGHRYVLEVTVGGGLDAHGMVMDFAVLDDLVERHVIDEWDHHFLLDRTDPFLPLMETLAGVVVLPFAPTAEQLAREVWRRLSVAVGPTHRILLVRLYETGNGWAEVS